MKANNKIGMGMKSQKKTKKKITKKRILLMAKRGNASHFYQLGAFEFLIGRAVSVTKRQQSHATSARGNCNITIARWIQPRIVSHSVQIRTLYLGLYKCARHSSEEKKNIKETIKMPSGATNVQLNELAKRMRVPYFRSLIFSFHVLY